MEIDRKVLGCRTLKLYSGSCYLPHPAKKETGGEDAHFICIDEQAIGTADGARGWADMGINAGLYTQKLMSKLVFNVPMAPGDIIVTGTDGLFDNLFSNEITAVIVHAIRAGLELQVVA
ncbi:hypothetical protein GIB67_032490 [Kingdonia uniflora]|uniref:Protein phosphatase n=1 Tax=Kingdonia uniflora TaxID=39325 RepID=A0A7J7L7H7_9MAGN|nr:hypothetical protein GIB67_032490 [Kingdonia uniflora]